MTYKEKFLEALRSGEYVEVRVDVTVPGCPQHECIYNPAANFIGKAEYYDRAYDDNLVLKANSTIRITAIKFEGPEPEDGIFHTGLLLLPDNNHDFDATY